MDAHFLGIAFHGFLGVFEGIGDVSRAAEPFSGFFFDPGGRPCLHAGSNTVRLAKENKIESNFRRFIIASSSNK